MGVDLLLSLTFSIASIAKRVEHTEVNKGYLLQFVRGYGDFKVVFLSEFKA